MNNSVFGKTIENLRKHRIIKLVATKKQRQDLVSELNYNTINAYQKITGNQNEENKSNNEQVGLSTTILEMNKIMIYDYWYDYTKPEYGDCVKLCYTDMNSFISHIKSEYVFVDITGDVETRFDASNYEVYQIMNHYTINR